RTMRSDIRRTQPRKTVRARRGASRPASQPSIHRRRPA
uniref:Uncharacterized protein n=1 Tax=Aegilops tauschii subsp. strangulata TaxID=200361 RepID=A0A453CRZ2_AEGTS